jgi:hypothetical protein
VYLLLAVLLVALFGVLVGVANNFYWGASQRPGGDYYLFNQPLPSPLGAMLWAALRPLLLLTPAAACWLLYLSARAKKAEQRPGLCPACGYDLRATPGRCPECGAAAAVSTSE